MCETYGKLEITYRKGNYIKGRIGHTGFYIPSKGGSKMAIQAQLHNGSMVNGTTVRGMLVSIRR